MAPRPQDLPADHRLRSVVARLPARLQPHHAPCLARLSTEGWRFVEVGAVMTQPFSDDGVAAVVGQPAGDLGAVLDEATAAGVLTERHGQLAFRHDLVRQAIYHEIPQGTRMAIHRMIENLEAADLAVLAVYRGESAGDRPAAPAPAPVPDPPDTPPGLVGWLSPGDLGVGRAQAENILGGVRGTESDGSLAGALSTLAFLAWNQGRVADAVGLQQAAARRAAPGSPPPRHLHLGFGLATMYTAVGAFPRAHETIGDIERGLGPRGAGSVAPHLEGVGGGGDGMAAAALLRSRLSVAIGRWADARRHAAGAAAWSGMLGGAALGVQAELALHDDDLKGGAALLARFQQGPLEAQLMYGVAAGWWRAAQLESAGGGTQAACDIMAPVYGEPAAHTRLLLEEPTSAAWLVRVALELGETAAAERVAAAADQLAASNWEYLSVVSAAAHARALLRRDAATLERLGGEHTHPLGRAEACADAGDILAQGGNRGLARLQLERALAIFECLDGRRHEARVRSRLDDLGSGRRRSRHGDRPVSGWASLTDAERRVADLVARGLSNPEAAKRLFLSRHTVDFHLRQVFRKLNIGSRVELSRLALERDLKPAPSGRHEAVLR
ncbi:MAG TPA: helix-turn-helix transcriptional regulator [Acidimicrobiales bacterium]|nr:helix-turn-helix transcriptional regulator [Acidimicrobiales bacterium]